MFSKDEWIKKMSCICTMTITSNIKKWNHDNYRQINIVQIHLQLVNSVSKRQMWYVLLYEYMVAIKSLISNS